MHIQGSENGDQISLPRMHSKCFLSVNCTGHQTGQDSLTKVLSSSVCVYSCSLRVLGLEGSESYRFPSCFHTRVLIVIVERPEMR